MCHSGSVCLNHRSLTSNQSLVTRFQVVATSQLIRFRGKIIPKLVLPIKRFPKVVYSFLNFNCTDKVDKFAGISYRDKCAF